MNDLEANQLKAERKAALQAAKAEHEEVSAVFLKVKGLIKDREKLAKFKEPVVLLERRSGNVDFFEGVTAREWPVPDQKIGEERNIYFTTPPKRFNYAGDTFRGYYCHEDYAYPIDMGHNAVWVQHPETKQWTLNKIDLRMANISAEGLRDLIRKVLVAWENYKTSAESAKWQAWAKMLMWVAVIGLGAYFIWAMFIQKKAPEQAAVQAAVNTTKVVIGGG